MASDSEAPGTKRPYPPPSNVTTVLHRLRSRNLPDRIDVEYLRDTGIPEGTISRTLFALRFLGLVNKSGEPSEALRSIHVSTDEEYGTILSGLIREAYADALNVINPAEDSQERIINVFRRYTPASQRSRMVIFFLGMCREAGMPTLDVPRQRAMAGTAAPAPRPPGKVPAPHTKEKARVADLPGVAPALQGLVRSLPPEGAPLSAERRRQWLKMAEATLAFVYPEENGEDVGVTEGEDNEGS